MVLGLGPIGDMATRVARLKGIGRVIGVDLVPERLERARRRDVDVLDLSALSDPADLIAAVHDATDGRGPDAVIDAVGMEAHGSPIAKAGQAITGLLPDRLAERLVTRVGIDRLAALHTAFQLVRRGGTVSILGVYGGMTDPMPMMTLFDKQVTLRMGQANVRRWSDDILEVLGGDDPLGVETFATHHVALGDAADAYRMFQGKQDGAVKVVFRP